MSGKSSKSKLTRLEIAECIIESPEAFKACESCDAIIFREDNICPVCGAYRFTKSKKTITRIAEEIKKEIQNKLNGELF